MQHAKLVMKSMDPTQQELVELLLSKLRKE